MKFHFTILISIFIVFNCGCKSGLLFTSRDIELRQTLYVSNTEYSLTQITNSLDNIKSRHNLVKRELNSSNIKRFREYDIAIFYSLPRTEYYGFGISVVTWSEMMEKDDSRYIVNTYSKNTPCNLCKDTINALNESGIEFELE